MSNPIDKPLSESLESGDGFVAPRYRSGQRSADALLEAGRALLVEISYEALSINDLCAEADLTKGAFYRRFESKDAFFLALQRLALDDAQRVQQALEQALVGTDGTPATFAECAFEVVEAVRLWHLRHRGVIRASLQRRDHTSDGWQPFKAFARGFVEDMATHLTPLPELRRNKRVPERLTVAFQTVIATMINAALNDPGPLSLADAAMTEALAEMLVLYVTSSVADTVKRSPAGTAPKG
ncbi:TetR/AcrR family transcriptional regulator [Paraburkholderia oxyphila]|uniref:TetR/AcrR family transcriptional regulator n=1 Tax=Paraburkholderia oxyphila TaxID=614212 RepID=UPI0006937860|nr:TetR/AcrR family transcriptional regulator [Paraburkholderia oxyphila]